ncbi:unnamed protein product [Rhizophagus irregularis]|nr:unnamed protein product [Rhizophagus irregularis]
MTTRLSKEIISFLYHPASWGMGKPQYQCASSLKQRLKEADNLQTNIDLWNDDMKKLAKSEVNNRVNMRNLENMTISTGISAERKRKADENSEVDGSGIIEWEFDCAILTWLEKGMLYHKELISEEDEDKRIKDSSKSIWWRIVDGSDLDVTREYLSEEECLELQEVLANALELGTTINDWTILKPQAEKCLQDLSKLNNDQIKIIGEKVLHKGTRGALEELKNFLKRVPKNLISAYLLVKEKNSKKEKYRKKYRCFYKNFIFSCLDNIMDRHFVSSTS